MIFSTVGSYISLETGCTDACIFHWLATSFLICSATCGLGFREILSAICRASCLLKDSTVAIWLEKLSFCRVGAHYQRSAFFSLSLLS